MPDDRIDQLRKGYAEDEYLCEPPDLSPRWPGWGRTMIAAGRAIRVSTAVAVLGVTGIAAYVSYRHAYDVVRAHGGTA